MSSSLFAIACYAKAENRNSLCPSCHEKNHQHSSNVTCASPRRQLQWVETSWIMFKALQQSLIRDIWRGWSSWWTQIRARFQIFGAVDKSMWCLNMSAQLSESLWFNQNPTEAPFLGLKVSLSVTRSFDGNVGFIKITIALISCIKSH